MQFKFKWLSENGQPQGVFSKQGRFDGETLIMDGHSVPAASLVHVENRKQRMVVSAVDENGRAVHRAFVMTKGSADRLKREIGIARSAVWADNHKKDLKKRGLGHTFKARKCPYCRATIVLTNLDDTPQVYCAFCDTVATVDGSIEKMRDENQYRICDECGMYSKPQHFTVFYFYFLLAVYGFSSRPTWRCPGCMRSEAWKMLFGNLIFVLGVPVALVQLFRSYKSSMIQGTFKGLDTANIKARRGDLNGAIKGYEPILNRAPVAAGIKFNLGRALLGQGKVREAADAFRLALADCSNYAPAFQLLGRCYQTLGEKDALKKLQAQWTLDEAQAEKTVAT